MQENDRTDNQAWLTTTGIKRPWNVDPPLNAVPFDDDMPERVLCNDWFHIWHQGPGRDFALSVIVMLCRLGYFNVEPGSGSNSLAAKLDRAFHAFKFWGKMNGISVFMRKMTQANFGMASVQSYPRGSQKGGDVIRMIKWFTFFINLCLNRPLHDSHVPLLEAAYEAAKYMSYVQPTIQSHGIWLPRSCALRVHASLKLFLRAWKFLANECFRMNVMAYQFRPKIHGLDHFMVEMGINLRAGHKFVLNPSTLCCDTFTVYSLLLVYVLAANSWKTIPSMS
jgi:hypothetical protein